MNNPANIFSDPDAFGTSLLAACTRVLANKDEDPLGFLQWDPETIWLELSSRVKELPQHNYSKLMAAIRIVTTDEFRVSLPVFIETCDILFDGRHDPRIFEPASVEDIAWGLVETTLLWPPDNDDPDFHSEIQAYIEEMVRREGMVAPPDAILLAIPEMKDQWSKVHESFSDDPEMFGMVQGANREKVSDVNDLVIERLQLLMEQLAGLQGQATDAAKLAQKVLNQLIPRQDKADTLSRLN